MSGRILVGTSSWADPGFVKEWYPPKLPAKQRLPWYAQRFEAVELNSSFYAVPDRNTVHGWVKSTPERFVFDVKAHRLLSRHAAGLDSLPPDLRDGARTNERGRVVLEPELEVALARRLVEETAPLAEAGKLGVYLLQLTPAFSPGRHTLEELDGLVECFAGQRLAIELRHRSWVSDKRREATLGWFGERDVAYVCVDAPPDEHFQIMPPLDAVTNDRSPTSGPTDATPRATYGQDRRGALRLALRRRRAGGDRRARARAGRAGRRGARGLQQQPRRRRAHRRASASARCSDRHPRSRSPRPWATTPALRRGAAHAGLARAPSQGAPATPAGARTRRAWTRPPWPRPSAARAARRGTAPSRCCRRAECPCGRGRTPVRRRSPR